MCELDPKEAWTLKNWCFWIVVPEKTPENPLNCQESKLINPKGNQPWVFFGKTNAEAEAPKLWPTDEKNQLIGKDPNAVKGWRQQKGEAEDEIVR